LSSTLDSTGLKFRLAVRPASSRLFPGLVDASFVRACMCACCQSIVSNSEKTSSHFTQSTAVVRQQTSTWTPARVRVCLLRGAATFVVPRLCVSRSATLQRPRFRPCTPTALSHLSPKNVAASTSLDLQVKVSLWTCLGVSAVRCCYS